MGGQQGRRLDAFISYGHAADGKLAPALQTGLQHLARPWFQRQALRVFRDDTGLSVNPDLWGSIRHALDNAEWCILLASPQAAASLWVNQEIEHWLASRPRGKILLVLTDGTLVWDAELHTFDPERSTALPPALRGYFDSEPRHLDLTWARDESQLDLRHSRFRAAVADLAAPIHGVDKDELESEDIRQHRQAVRWRRAAVTGLVALLVLAVTASVFAFGQRNRAVAQARVAESQRLAIQAQSLTGSQLDVALLLASAGFGLDDSTASRQGLVSALSAEPQLDEFEHRFGSALGTFAVSADGGHFVVGGQDGSLRTWNGADRIGPAVEAGVGSLLDATFSPDGSTVAVSGDEGVRLFDASLAPLGVTLKTRGVPEWIALSPDGRLLATSGSRGSLQLWRVPTGEVAITPVRASPTRTTAVVFTDAGRHVWIGTDEGTLVRVDTSTGTRDRTPVTLPGSGSTYALAISPDDQTLVASQDDGSVYVLDPATGAIRRGPLLFHSSQPYAMAFDPSGRLFASADDTGAIAVWQTDGGDEPTYTMHGHGDLVSDVAFTGPRTFVSSAAGELIRWNLDGEPFGSRVPTSIPNLTAVAARPGSAEWVVAGRGGQLISGTQEEPALDDVVTVPLADVRAVAWSPDGRMLAVGGGQQVRNKIPSDGEVVFYSWPDRMRRTTLPIGAAGVLALAVSGDGARMAVGTTAGEVTVWDLATRRRLGPTLIADSDGTGANSVAFSPDGQTLVAGGNSGSVTAWRIGSARQLWRTNTGSNVNAVAWARGSATIVAGNGLSQVARLRAADGKAIGEPVSTGVGEVSALSLNRSGTSAAVTGKSGRVAIIDLTTGERPYLFTGRPESGGVAFVDDQLIVSAGATGDVVSRRLDPGEWRQRACREAARQLTDDERRTYLSGLDLDPCR